MQEVIVRMKLRLEFVSSHRKGKSKPPNGKFIGEVDLGEGATVGALKEYMKRSGATHIAGKSGGNNQLQ